MRLPLAGLWQKVKAFEKRRRASIQAVLVFLVCVAAFTPLIWVTFFSGWTDEDTCKTPDPAEQPSLFLGLSAQDWMDVVIWPAVFGFAWLLFDFVRMVTAGHGKANQREVDLRKVNLRGADLREADLSAANLRKADLRGADLREADLSEADLYRADLRKADLRGGSLREANLHKANLRRADLQGVNLRGANLRGANLRRAFLWGTDLRGVDLYEAKVTGEQLAQARSLKGATMPDGTVHE
jgi:hypothetical protein